MLGAGMIGVSAALALQARGLRVALIDRRGPGEETSWGNAGIVFRTPAMAVPFPRRPGQLLAIAAGVSPLAQLSWRAVPGMLGWLARFVAASYGAGRSAADSALLSLARPAPALHAAWLADAGAAQLIRRTGCYELFMDERSFRLYESVLRQAESLGIASEILSPADLRAREPAVRGALRHAVFWPGSMSSVNPGAVVCAYADLFRRRGGILAVADAAGLATNESGFHLRSEAASLRAPRAVVALGPWSDEFCRRLGYRVPLAFKRGYSRHYGMQAGVAPPSCPLVAADRGFVVTAMQAGIRLTSGVEFARRDAAPRAAVLRSAEKLARALLPALGRQVEAQPWMGRRPCTPDMRPVIGPCPAETRLILAFGHHHWGFALGPPTGELVADIATGVATPAQLEPFRPDRF